MARVVPVQHKPTSAANGVFRPVSAQNASTSGIAARAAAGDLALPRANHANAVATAELLRARASPRPGSDPPDTRPARPPGPINASRFGPSCQDTRHVDRSHSHQDLTWASLDSTLESQPWRRPPVCAVALFVPRNEIPLDCNVTPRAYQAARRRPRSARHDGNDYLVVNPSRSACLRWR